MKKLLLLFIILSFSGKTNAQNSYPVDDTIHLYPFIPDTIDVLANDYIHPGDSVKSVIWRMRGPYCRLEILSKGKRIYTLEELGQPGYYKGTYSVVTKYQGILTANLITVIHDSSYKFLDINNVKAGFSSNGLHFFRDSAEFFVPKWTSQTSVFSNSIWVGGKDQNGDIHLAAQKYGQGNSGGDNRFNFDYFAGPVLDSSLYNMYSNSWWTNIWNIRKQDVEYHRQHFREGDYKMPQDIKTWPGNGSPINVFTEKLAPFADSDGDGKYNPRKGDYPEVRGDQCLWFIFNDDRDYHTESLGEKLGIEVHGMAYAFDLPDDSALKNTVFLNYRIINRSQNIYDSTYIAFLNDFDIGYGGDDFTGCDVERNLVFSYNGDSIDGTGQLKSYGKSPPAQGMVILSGARIDDDYQDNPKINAYGEQLCDYSANGRFFGDSIIDNERYGMTSFMRIPNTQWIFHYFDYFDEPSDYYLAISGRWNDSSYFRYGGNGHPTNGGIGPECKFMFPGLSDTTDFGTSCINPDPKNWTEETTGNMPSDRRGLISSGPFTFKPGDIQEIDIAFIWARDYEHGNSVDKLRKMTDLVREAFEKNELSNGQHIIGVGENSKDAGWKVYPSPAVDFINIEIDKSSSVTGVELISPEGSVIRSFNIKGQKTRIDVSDVPAGFYLLRSSGKTALTMKIVIK